MSDADRPARRYKSPSQLARESSSPSPYQQPPSSTSSPGATTRTTPPTTLTQTPQRNTPYLPTPTELSLLLIYPSILLFGTLFSLLSPETRASPYDPIRQAHTQDAALVPSYFARKDNLLNVVFVKRGWAWVSVVVFVFWGTHPRLGSNTNTSGREGRGKGLVRGLMRYGLVTAWWVFVTQWFFGPAIIDRGFRWSGGRCEVVEEAVRVSGDAVSAKEVFTAAACKASGGNWSGGHDISGHVFLLVLGSFFLVQEVGWVVGKWARAVREERCVVMGDGAVKGAAVTAERKGKQEEEGVVVSVVEALGLGGKLAAVVVALCGWMLLMTAIYFHTWFEKFTGLLTAFIGLYAIYIVPRWVPALRGIVGLPGI
ncbi:inositol phospholipid synthesis and fat-storage-inducing TM-domain-containing protein [Dichotomopilus funicola]|uniref:Acyl-coenzyme A diphosphatase SCS3 n=1 Tax=Dichotomopilus funicola TaxID=1934379 RepID=A0AAN6UXN0_9PEZI|nr:inositol phospholipid synthesis and fat-storage-inducing TM-domain-containing protein [Dichotomopilus funicola]